MHKKAKLLILFVLLLCCVLTGCYDSREIDDEVYAVSIGVDKGVDNKLRITIQYPTYKSETGGSGSEPGKQGSANLQSGSNIDTIEAPTIIEGIDMYGMTISRRVSLMHAKMLVLSEDLAREGVGYFMGAFKRFRELRSTMAIAVVSGKAEDFILENKSNIGGSISKATEQMFLEAVYSNYFPVVRFSDFYKAMISTYSQPIATYGGVNDFSKMRNTNVKSPTLNVLQGFLPGNLPRRGDVKSEFTGTAVFDGDKMVGSLDSYETTYYLMMIGKFPIGAVTLVDPHAPGKAIVLDMRNGRTPKIKAYFIQGRPVIDVYLNMEADVESIQSRINYEDLGKIQELNLYIRDNLLKGMQALVKKTQVELNSDIFGYGRYVAANFGTIQDWEKYKWLNHYKEAKVNINLEVNIRRTGLMLTSSPIFETTDAKKQEESK